MDAIIEQAEEAERLFTINHSNTNLLELLSKLFGDLHGQFGGLMRLFDEYGSPSTAGDTSYIDYLFLGDYFDREENYIVEGLRPNARGPGLVTFGVRRYLVVVPKLIHPFCLQQFHPLKGHIEDAWMLVDISSLHQELNANRPATPTRGRPLQMTKEVLWLQCKVEEEALMHICLLVFHLMFVYRKDEVWRNQQGCKLR
ncbi:hypothetical protein F2Q69_00026085 [Brassica cretica]|uniref:Calcineurin-like phosphoesterase domain-containing protein n=1 Tax=Brassica cretica TaxID=69181 RepID=A0A8S9S3G5_BRACR|nr:hypothetical protein F2Q69_00026085 [Brassica cretica]